MEYHGGVHSRLLYPLQTQKYFEFYSVLTVIFSCVLDPIILKILIKKDTKTLTIEYHGGVHSRLLYTLQTQKYFEFYSVLTVIFSCVLDPITGSRVQKSRVQLSQNAQLYITDQDKDFGRAVDFFQVYLPSSEKINEISTGRQKFCAMKKFYPKKFCRIFQYKCQTKFGQN